MTNSAKVYVDSCCFIELVKFRRGMPLDINDDVKRGRENECWFLHRLCEAARDGQVNMVTSMLTVAECTHVGEIDGPSQETRELFIEFLTSGEIAHLIEPDIFVAEHARDLLWNHEIKLKGADALHVATASLEGCREFVTLDARIEKQVMKEAIPKLKKIGLQVTLPHQNTALPIEYRQGTINDRA